MANPNYFTLIIFSFLLSCSGSSFYDLEDFSTVPKADVHVHIRNKRDGFVQQAIKDNFKLVNIVVDGEGTWEGIYDQFECSIFQQTAHPDRVKIITAFSVEDFHQAGWEDKTMQWIKSSFNQGAIGLKVWKNIGMVLKDTNEVNVMIDDARLDGIFNYLEQEGKIVIGHLGEPLNCWLPLEEMTTNNDRIYFSEHPQYHMYLHPELPAYEDQMAARNRRLDKHPNLKFVGAHVASLEWSVDTLANWLDHYPDATVDLAARMGQIFWQTQQDREKVRNFFIKYQDRVMYATDFVERETADPEVFTKDMHDTWFRDWQYFVTDNAMESKLINGTFQGLKLPKAAVDKVFFDNAVRVFGF